MFPVHLITDMVGGWACFVVSILWIGVLTAFINDLASSFGCTIGLLDSVTAISFVALGTSIPGKNKNNKSYLSFSHLDFIY